MNNNLETMTCNELRQMARDLGIKGYQSMGKTWLKAHIQLVLEEREAEKKEAERKEAERKEAERKSNKNAVKPIEYNGKSQSVGAWAKELGMPVATLKARLRNGWTIEQALSKASAGKGENLIEFNGKSQTLSAWARELGVPRPTLAARLYRLNWTPEKAFTMATTIG